MSNVIVHHPDGGTIFAIVEGVNNRRIQIAEGPVILRVGTPQKFGLEHIWERHGVDLKGIGYADKSFVQRYVADILQPGTSLLDQSGALWEKRRLLALRRAFGIAVLQEIEVQGLGTCYSVITAYPASRAQGTAVTRLLQRPEPSA